MTSEIEVYAICLKFTIKRRELKLFITELLFCTDNLDYGEGRNEDRINRRRAKEHFSILFNLCILFVSLIRP